MPLIAAFHEVFGLCLVPESRVRLHPDAWSTYDPAEHNVDPVVDHLQQAGPRERARVLELERAGKARKTVLAEDSLTEHPSTPDADGAGDTPTQTGTVPGTSTED